MRNPTLRNCNGPHKSVLQLCMTTNSGLMRIGAAELTKATLNNIHLISNYISDFVRGYVLVGLTKINRSLKFVIWGRVYIVHFIRFSRCCYLDRNLRRPESRRIG